MLITVYNVSIIFSMDKKDLVLTSIQSAANFIVYAQYSGIKDRVFLLKDFCIVSTKRLMTQCLFHKCKSKA